jgi:hypothetical protein
VKHYSAERKEAILRQMMPPTNKLVSVLAREHGISEQTLYTVTLPFEIFDRRFYVGRAIHDSGRGGNLHHETAKTNGSRFLKQRLQAGR